MSLLPIISSIRRGGSPSPPPGPAKPLFVFTGESNSGGYAQNQSAELGDHASVKILNNTTLTSFDTLHVSTIGDGVDNTHVGHAGAETWGARHGWEVELANRILAGTFGSNPGYLVKTGQGGSKIADWAGVSTAVAGETVNSRQLFQNRLNAAIPMLTTINGGVAPDIYVFYSQGINDAIAGTDHTTWTNATIAYLNWIKTNYSGVKGIVMTKFMTAYSAYDALIDSVCAAVTNCFSITTNDLTTESDGNHWDDPSIATCADRIMNLLKANYTIN